MNRIFTIAVSTLAIVFGQTAPATPDQNCASVIVITEYPVLARWARISGPVAATYAIDGEGKASKVKLEGHPLLTKSADEWIRQPRYPGHCRSRTVDFVFRFEFDGALPEKPVTLTRFNAPAEHVITTSYVPITHGSDAEVKPKATPDTRAVCPPRVSGRRLTDTLEVVEFRVPRPVSVQTSNDVDYIRYYIPDREKGSRHGMQIMFGAHAGSEPADLRDSSIQWTATSWSCSGITGTEWRGVRSDGLRWRRIGIPLSGFADYSGVSARAAKFFDRILDSMCCGKCEACVKDPRLPSR